MAYYPGITATRTIDQPTHCIDTVKGAVIGETAIIGNRVRLHHGMTLGSIHLVECELSDLGRARHPIVEDDVVIYAGAAILGPITIGRGSTIGGNVCLTQGGPAGSQIWQAQVR